MIGRRLAVCVITIACGAAGAAQQPRDNVTVAGGSASIAGRVFVAGAAKQPARRVRVTLTNLAHSSPGQTTTTDDGGAFAFRGVPAGRFEVQAFKNGYLRASYGAARPDRAGTPIVVNDGDTIADLSLSIARGGVITGAVRDIRGRPAPGMSVRVLKLGYDATTGAPTLAAPATSTVRPTDDRGEYRAFGLPPGGYLVLVTPSTFGRSGGPGGVDDIRQMTSPQRVNYAPVFHPGVTDVAAAATVALGLSEERAGIDVMMQLVPTATVSGRISFAAGALPQGLFVSLLPAGPRADLLAGAGLRSASVPPRADGVFAIAGVAPGTYTIKALTGRGRGAPANVATVSASADIVVNGQDLDVPLTLQPGVPVNGRVVFEGSRPTAAELQKLAFSLAPTGTAGTAPASGAGRVDADGRFAFASVAPDTYRFVETWNAPGVGDRWAIASSVAGGWEALDSPLRVNPGEALEWTVTYTDRPSRLTGTLQDRSGRAATDYSLLVFPADRAYWVPGSRRIRLTRPATDGTFSVVGLPAGDYLLAALADLEPGEWNDPTLLAQLAASSIAVTLRERATTTQDVRVGK